MANTSLDAAGATIYLLAPFGDGSIGTPYNFGSAVYFQRNSVASLPILDTSTPANNRGMPVVLLSADGATPFSAATGTSSSTAIATFDNTLDFYITGQGSQTAINQNIVLATAGTGSTDCQGYRSISIQINVASGTVTAGNITFEGSNDNTNWQAIALYDEGSQTANPLTTYAIAASTNRFFAGSISFRYFRARISTGLTGTTTGLQAFTTLRNVPFTPRLFAATQATAANLTATVSLAASQTLATVTTLSTLTNITNWGNLVDNAAFTDGTTRLSMSGYILDETAGTALTENDGAAARIDSKRAQVFTLEDATTRGQRQAVSAAGAAKINSSVFNPTATITRPANTTAYTAGDVVGGAITLSSSGNSGGNIVITDVFLRLDIAAVPSGMTTFTLYLYNVTPPSAVADNGVFDLPSGDRASFLGSINIPAPTDLGSTCYAQVSSVNLNIKLASASLFAYLVTTGGYTPAANSEVYQLWMTTREP